MAPRKETDRSSGAVNKQRRASSSTGNKKSGGSWLGLMFKLFIFCLILLAIPAGYLGAKVYQQLKDMPDISVLEKYEPIEAIQIYDKNDRLVCTVEGDEDRRVVPLSQISTQMQQAMLAAEDHHFYEHHGINPMSIVRAFFTNLQAGRVVEGGSTITQQLVKNLFFEDKGRTFDRKIKEAFMSYEVEQRYTKDRILEMYLNQVYFGNGGYGIERAGQRYFGRSAANLDLAQAAFLAGLVKAPSELGNPDNREAALTRQTEILGRMVEFGYITQDQAMKAAKEKLVFKKTINPLQKYPYYVSFVLEQLRGRFSEAEMRRQGLRVYTNLDPAVQQLAEKTLNDDIKKAPKGVSQSALVCISVKDGAVLALVGGVGDFWKNQFNRATNPHTAGSSFKPFVYLTAFLKNIFRPDSYIDDTPITIRQGWGLPDWTPKNFDHRFMGHITIRRALSQSRNVPAVKVGKAVGIDNVVETARLAGITTRLDPNLSLALGSSAVTPLDMAGAYSTFARGGIAIKPQVLRRIENNRGQIIEAFEPKVDKVFDSDAVARLVDVMQDVVRAGTGTAARLPDRPVAGKTGTADQGKDIWFCGFTPDTVCTLWGGNDENLPIPGHNVTGGAVMAKIWKDFMTAYYDMRPAPPGAFMPPSKRGDELVEQGENPDGMPSADVPKLIPLAPEADNSGPELVPITPSVREAPPAVNPSSTYTYPPEPVLPQSSPAPGGPPPLAPVAVPSTYYSNPAPVPAPARYYTPISTPSSAAPYAVPHYSTPSNTAPSVAPPPSPSPVPVPVPVPVPTPAAQGYGGSYGGSYGTGSVGSPRSAPVAATLSGYPSSSSRSATVLTGNGSKRTIINEDGGSRYFSVSEPNTAAGSLRRRFTPSSGTPSNATPSAAPTTNPTTSPGSGF
jgi:penicillin-binding protein 1A